MHAPKLGILLALVASVMLSGCKPDQPAAQQSQQNPPQVQTASAGQQAPAALQLPVAEDLLADNYFIVFDASGSMASSSCGTGNSPRIETAKTGVIAFIDSVPEKANVGLYVFSAQGRKTGVWIELGTRNRAELKKQIQSIQPSGGTPLYASMKDGWDILTRQSQMQSGYGTYNMVVVTDGESSDSDPGPLARQIVRSSPVNVHVIGFCVDGKHSLDIKGVTKFAAASNPETLKKGLAAILAESERYQDAQFK